MRSHGNTDVCFVNTSQVYHITICDFSTVLFPPSPVFSWPSLASKAHPFLFLNIVFTPLHLSLLLFQSFHCALQNIFSSGCLDLSMNILIGDMVLIQDVQ